MRSALVLLLLCSTSALAEQNPFLPPEARQSTQGNQIAPTTISPNGQVVPVAPVVSPQALKMAELRGARMVAIINGEEVWYKPTEGVYVRYSASPSSKNTLESQAQAPEVEDIEKKIADVQKAAQKPTKQAKQW